MVEPGYGMSIEEIVEEGEKRGFISMAGVHGGRLHYSRHGPVTIFTSC